MINYTSYIIAEKKYVDRKKDTAVPQRLISNVSKFIANHASHLGNAT